LELHPILLPIAAASEDLCLDYANTLAWRGSLEPVDSLGGFADLLGWLGGSAGQPAAPVEQAREWARDRPRAADLLFADAMALREAIYRVFAAVAERRPAAESDLAALNRALAETPHRERLVATERAYAWAVAPSSPSAAVLLAPVVWSAADLLTRIADRRVRRCANDRCLWLFLDHSKGGTRRWCDMNSCGNRAKSRRHYLKGKPAATRPPP
jgi:predicted RNA-binding Zn ribbon-like protein